MKLKHGYAKGKGHYLYKKYLSILTRCRNPNEKCYKNYGGRGIDIHFKNFIEFKDYILSTIGERPSEEYSLDRIENDKGYEPDNLRWALDLTQKLNRRQIKSKLGVRGVFLDKRDNSYSARIKIDKKYIHLGRTKDLNLAREMVLEAYYNNHKCFPPNINQSLFQKDYHALNTFINPPLSLWKFCPLGGL